MNANLRLTLFVLLTLSVYLSVSIVARVNGIGWQPLERINLVADIWPPDSARRVPERMSIPVKLSSEKQTSDQFLTLMQEPGRLINLSNSDAVALPGFTRKLLEQKRSGKRKIRVAYFGDSMIEGDLISQTFRRLLQEEFGGSGVGYVPVTSQVARFRQSAFASYSGNWEDYHFKRKGSVGDLYLSGHVFLGNGEWVEISDQTLKNDSAAANKYLLCGGYGNPVEVKVNGESVRIEADKRVNRVLLSGDAARQIKLQVNNGQFPVFGISFESAFGVIVDNFSFRGISGIELAAFAPDFLKAIAEVNDYDLIIFQYGVNLLYKPNDREFGWYVKAMKPVIRNFREAFAGADLLIVSSGDRAFRYNGEWKTAVGMDSLIMVQARLAKEEQCPFFNLFATMGGRNAVLDWVSRNPPMLARDYVHPNFRGAEWLGTSLFKAVMDDFRKNTQ